MMSYDWTKAYKGNLDWLPRRTIFMCRAGSMAYGTNGPDSDVDQRGVFIPTADYILGYLKHIDQVDNGWIIDGTSYALARFISLVVVCNPNMIELLYTDPIDWLLSTKAWEDLHSIRHLFLSQQAKHRFCGYAISQLQKIKAHRSHLLSPPSHKPTREEFGLPNTNAIPKEQRDALEAMMLKVVEEWQVDYAMLDDATRIDLLNKQAVALADMKLAKDDQYVAAGNKLGLDLQAMEYLKAERAYRGALAGWGQYQTWLKERNPVRAELEARYGYDTKHGGHLVRLLRMAREIIVEGKVNVRRTEIDADELKAIRFNGAWSYERLLDWAQVQDKELTELMKSSPLPKQPDREAIDKKCIELTHKYLYVDP
jgi:predicted nucleotidyltransferase